MPRTKKLGTVNWGVVYQTRTTVRNIGVAAIGAMGAKAPLTRKGTCLSGTKKYLSIELNTRK